MQTNYIRTLFFSSGKNDAFCKIQTVTGTRREGHRSQMLFRALRFLARALHETDDKEEKKSSNLGPGRVLVQVFP